MDEELCTLGTGVRQRWLHLLGALDYYGRSRSFAGHIRCARISQVAPIVSNHNPHDLVETNLIKTLGVHAERRARSFSWICRRTRPASMIPFSTSFEPRRYTPMDFNQEQKWPFLARIECQHKEVLSITVSQRKCRCGETIGSLSKKGLVYLWGFHHILELSDSDFLSSSWFHSRA